MNGGHGLNDKCSSLFAALLLCTACSRSNAHREHQATDAAVREVAATAASVAAPPSHKDVRFVGSEACKSCHAREHAAWSNSQHQRAMQHATEGNVLGNFSGARFRYAG